MFDFKNKNVLKGFNYFYSLAKYEYMVFLPKKLNSPATSQRVKMDGKRIADVCATLDLIWLPNLRC